MGLNTYGQNTYTGVIHDIGDIKNKNAYFTLMTFSGTYILTLNSLPISTTIANLIVDDIVYFLGDIVTITGTTSKRQGIFFEEDYELEIKTIEKSSLTQNIQPFLGTYTVEMVCNTNGNNTQRKNEIILRGWQGRLFFYMRDYSTQYYDVFEVFTLEDSLYIPIQYLITTTSEFHLLTGKGKIDNDSIFLSTIFHIYSITDTLPKHIEVCECKGKRKEVGISPIESIPNKVYYNAVKQELVIENLQNQSLTLELYDIQGRIILRTDANNPISIAHLSNGVYVYRLLENKQVIGKGKVVK